MKEINGASATYTTVDNSSNRARFKTKDETVRDLNYPCIIPSAGFNYSYWKSYCLDIAGSFTRVNNIRVYFASTCESWTYGAGGGVFAGQLDATPTVTAQGVVVANYVQALGSVGVSGNWFYDVSVGHTYYKTGVGVTPVDVTTFTSGAPMVVDLDNHDAAEKSKYFIMQTKIDTIANGAVQGLQAVEVVTWMWDEI